MQINSLVLSALVAPCQEDPLPTLKSAKTIVFYYFMGKSKNYSNTPIGKLDIQSIQYVLAFLNEVKERIVILYVYSL